MVMARYSDLSKEAVRDAVDFVELVSPHSELRRTGPAASYKGLCPFHDERTPSFHIETQRKVYYCFGCEAAGDVFSFVQAVEGLNFPGAMEFLAARYNVALESEDEDPAAARRRERRERLLELVSRSARFYERTLWGSPDGAPALAYLRARDLDEPVLREFRVGYAPPGGQLTRLWREQQIPEQDLLDAGLAQRCDDGSLRECFRARISFPLSDLRGRIVGFGARALGEREPKYLNSPDCAIYRKGRHLYGAHQARPHATRAASVILTEGYTDVIAMHQAGLQNTVGLMGTALTDEQLAELARMAATVTLALDGDRAGAAAMLRAAEHASQRKLTLRVAKLDPGSDPAEMIEAHDRHTIRLAIEQAVPFAQFRVEQTLQSAKDQSASERDRIISELQPVFAALPPGALRHELLRLTASQLELPDALIETLLPHQDTPSADSRPAREPTRRILRGDEQAERALLALCIAAPEHGRRTLEQLNLTEHFTSPPLRHAAEALLAGDLREPMRATTPSRDSELVALLSQLVIEASGQSATPAVLDVQRHQLELHSLDRQLARARPGGHGNLRELASQRAHTQQEFQRAYARLIDETSQATGTPTAQPTS
jgi:DNA primase